MVSTTTVPSPTSELTTDSTVLVHRITSGDGSGSSPSTGAAPSAKGVPVGGGGDVGTSGTSTNAIDGSSCDPTTCLITGSAGAPSGTTTWKSVVNRPRPTDVATRPSARSVCCSCRACSHHCTAVSASTNAAVPTNNRVRILMTDHAPSRRTLHDG